MEILEECRWFLYPAQFAGKKREVWDAKMKVIISKLHELDYGHDDWKRHGEAGNLCEASNDWLVASLPKFGRYIGDGLSTSGGKSFRALITAFASDPEGFLDYFGSIGAGTDKQIENPVKKNPNGSKAVTGLGFSTTGPQSLPLPNV